MRAIVPLVLALAGLLAPAPALGHGGESHDFGFYEQKLAGRLQVGLRFPVQLMTANATIPVVVEPYDPYEPATSGVSGVDVRLVAPDGKVTTVALAPQFAAFAGNVSFRSPGTWKANATLLPAETSVEWTFPVWAAGPYEATWVNAQLGDLVVSCERVNMEIEVREWRTLARAQKSPPDATARIERWTDDHKTKLGESIVPLEIAGTGLYRLRQTFAEAGMHHVLFASPGLAIDYDDRPYIHVTSLTPEKAKAYSMPTTCGAAATPFAGGAIAVLAVAVAAVATASRRR